MVKTLRRRLADGRTRKLIATIFAGKMLGVIAVLFVVNQIVGLIDTPASAQTVTHQASDLVNPVNTVWVLVTAFLVFFMQAGFMALEAGFARSRETVNVLTECVVDTFLCGLLFWAFGFAFMFGEGNGLIGHQYFLLHGAPATYGSTGVAFLAFWLFQFAFADTCSTITSGAMVGRTGFKGDLLYSIGVSGFIYPIFGHWVWGPGGWLGTMTPGFLNSFTGGTVFRDFAGSTVVHTVGGFIALAGAHRLGPAARSQVQAGRWGPPPPSRPDDRGHRRCDPVVRLVRVQPGVDALRARLRGDRAGRGQHDPRRVRGRAWWRCSGSTRARRNGTSACASTGSWEGWWRSPAPCYWVSPGGAVLIGGIAGIVVPLAVDFIEHIRVDDPVGAVAVHGFAGIWGTLSVGLFATGAFGVPTADGVDTSTTVKGLFYGGGIDQLKAQFVGSLTCIVVISAVAMALMYLVKATGTLRVSKDGELEGLDIHEHGTPPYHVEFGQGHDVLHAGQPPAP